MRAVKCKAMARLVYGDMARRPGPNMSYQGRRQFMAIATEMRKVYRRAKRSYRDWACVLLLLEMAR